MTKEREALKLALEALLDNQHYVVSYESRTYSKMYSKAIRRCEEALAQLVQKPVARAGEVMTGDLSHGYALADLLDMYSGWMTGVGYTSQQEAMYACSRIIRALMPFYTSPPKRQPLTDEQRRKMWRESDFRGNGGQIDWFIEGTRAAETAHGITGVKS
jgi:hypothetical protein